MLKFDADTHTYTYEGLVVPGVTTVLEESGISSIKYIKPDRLDYLRQRGTAVHLACEYFDKNILGSLPDEISGYVDAWKDFLIDNPFEFECIEERVFNKEHFFAGTVDRIGELDGDKWILDIKTGYDSKSYQVQTAGYRLAYEPDMRKKIRRACVLLTEDGKYDLKEHDDNDHIEEFKAALKIYNFHKRRK